MKTKRLIDADDLLIAFGNALNNATLKIGYGFMEWVVNEQPTIDPESLRPTAKWLVVRLMADGAECKCGHCGRHETFTSFDKHTDHVYCCRCGYKMEGLEYERKKDRGNGGLRLPVDNEFSTERPGTRGRVEEIHSDDLPPEYRNRPQIF